MKKEEFEFPEGWNTLVLPRKMNGKDTTYNVYVAPDGTKLRSMVGVKRFLGIEPSVEDKKAIKEEIKREETEEEIQEEIQEEKEEKSVQKKEKSVQKKEKSVRKKEKAVKKEKLVVEKKERNPKRKSTTRVTKKSKVSEKEEISFLDDEIVQISLKKEEGDEPTAKKMRMECDYGLSRIIIFVDDIQKTIAFYKLFFRCFLQFRNGGTPEFILCGD